MTTPLNDSVELLRVSTEKGETPSPATARLGRGGMLMALAAAGLIERVPRREHTPEERADIIAEIRHRIANARSWFAPAFQRTGFAPPRALSQRQRRKRARHRGQAL